MTTMRQRLLGGVAAIGLVAGSSAQAQEARTEAADGGAVVDITVIGTRASGRSTTGSPVPIDVLHGDT
ncbi:MAG: hypothetical protein EOP67_57390, partial [Sphingomonas sp.]